MEITMSVIFIFLMKIYIVFTYVTNYVSYSHKSDNTCVFITLFMTGNYPLACVRQAKFCLRVCQVVFSGFSCFCPHKVLIGHRSRVQARTTKYKEK